MKRILLVAFVILSCIGAFGQSDILIQGNGPYYNLGHGLTWAQKGLGGTDNAFILFPTRPDSNLCVVIGNNNPVSSYAPSFGAFAAQDANVKGFYAQGGTSAKWSPIPALGGSGGAIGPKQQTAFFVPAMAASELAIVINAGSAQSGSPNTADIYAVSTTSQSCGTDQPAFPKLIGSIGGLGAYITSTTQSPRNMGEIPITPSPYSFSDAGRSVSGDTTITIQLEPYGGVFSSCSFYLDVYSLSGTSPSLSVYIEQRIGTNQGAFDVDIGSFSNPYTSAGGFGMLNWTANAPGTSQTPKYISLPANTVLNGPIIGNIEATYVLSGTSPTSVSSLYGVCQ